MEGLNAVVIHYSESLLAKNLHSRGKLLPPNILLLNFHRASYISYIYSYVARTLYSVVFLLICSYYLHIFLQLFFTVAWSLIIFLFPLSTLTIWKCDATLWILRGWSKSKIRRLEMSLQSSPFYRKYLLAIAAFM